MLQSPVGNTIWAWCLADLETLNSVFTSVWLVCAHLRVQRVCPHRLINHLNHCLDGRIVHRLKLSLQTVGKGFGFLGVRELGALVYPREVKV